MHLILCLALGLLPQNEAPKPVAIQNVTIIDMIGQEPLANRTVIIHGDRIKDVVDTQTAKLPADATIIDGQGKFLIPGLWDMHIHWYGKEQLPLFTANGVTGVRFMFGHPMARAWKKEMAEGKLTAPRMVLASRIVDGPKPIWPGSIAVATPEEGRKSIETTKKEEYDFIKVYSLLSRESYFAIADEAKKQGMVFAGHVPTSVSAAEASDAGQKSFEHLYGILLGCSAKEEELTKAYSDARQANQPPDRALLRRISLQVIDSYDDKKATELFAKFKKNGTWQVPTLTVLRALAYLDDEKFVADARKKYMPAYVITSWNPKNDSRLSRTTVEDYAHRKVTYNRELQLVKQMHEAGVGILAGTDTLNPYCFPGFSIHDELALLVEAGLTPRDALLTATRNPAQFLGREKDLGVIGPGKLADLVLLDANPLTDISNSKKIAGVMQNGKWHDRAALQKMLDAAEKAVGKR